MHSQFTWDDRLYVPVGSHAFLGASTYSRWWNKTPEEVHQLYKNIKAKERGITLHAMAAEDIRMKMLRPKNNQTFNRYVNDAINFGMRPEELLYFSKYVFGTTDAISFDGTKLRIHDLKTGLTEPSMHQLEAYAAYFFLEYGTRYGFTPKDVETELRLYWNDQVIKAKPAPIDISMTMDKLYKHDGYLTQNEELL